MSFSPCVYVIGQVYVIQSLCLCDRPSLCHSVLDYTQPLDKSVHNKKLIFLLFQPARYHTFVEIDHEIISTVILLPYADLFKKGCCQLQAKVCAQITG